MPPNNSSSAQAMNLRQAISTLEAQRAVLGNDVVDALLAVLHPQLAQAEGITDPSNGVESPRLITCLVANLVSNDSKKNPRSLIHGFNLIAETVRLYGGKVRMIRSSYLIALFSALPDDPLRASHAALEMRKHIRDYAEELEATGQPGVVFRAGLNTGVLAAGTTHGASQGEAIDVAGFLSQRAPPNAILVSGQMYAYLANEFNLQPASTVEIAGRGVITYRLIESWQPPVVHRQGPPLEMPFIGRTDEMHAILSQTERLGGGKGGIVVIAGESGLGKTRLVMEARHAAPTVQWLDARCQAGPIKLTYGPWSDLLLSLIGGGPLEPNRDVAKKLTDWLAEHDLDGHYPFLANQLGIDTPEGEPSPQQIIRGTVLAWQAVLNAIAKQRPTVIVLDEAQAMDSLSLTIFEASVENAYSLPVLWIVVTQPLFNEPAAKTLTRLARGLGDEFSYLGLEPIDEKQALTTLRALLNVKTLPDPFEAGMLARAHGNPLLLQQLLRAMIDRRGVIRDARGQWQVAASALNPDMPDALYEVIQLRVSLLPGDARELLQQASVAGDALLPGLLAALPSAPNRARLISLLQDTGFLDDSSRFVNPMLCDAVYQQIPKPQVPELHRQVVAILTRNGDLKGPWLGAAAHHMARGLQTQGALRVYGDAKTWAYANQALFEVSEIIGGMLDLLHERDTPEQVARLLLEQQDVLYKLNPADERCKELLERAYELWIKLSNWSEAAATLLRVAVHYAGTPYEDECYQNAQTLLERENPRHEMLPDVYLQRALYAAGHGQDSREMFERARKLAKALRNLAALAHIHFEIGLYLRTTRNLLGAKAAFEQALSYFSLPDQSSRDEQILTYNYLADLCYHLGKPAMGEQFATDAVTKSHKGSDMVRVLPYVTLSECYAAQARWQDAIQILQEAPADLAPEHLPLPFWLGRWQFESGDTLGGLELMRESVPADNLECMLTFIDYLLDGGFPDEAELRLRQLGKPENFKATTLPARAIRDRLLGRLATATNDHARAIAHLDKAIHQFHRENFVLLRISTCRVYACALMARRVHDDERKAREILEQCLADCKGLSIHAESRRLQNTIRGFWYTS